MPISNTPIARAPMWLLALLPLVGAILGCEAENQIVASAEVGSILVLGDSIMAWNLGDEASVADAIASELDRAAINASVSGARLSFPDDEAEFGALGYDIRAQYRPGDWEWVVLNGGANDLAYECGCGQCEAILDAMVSADGQVGQYPDFVRSVVDDNNRAIVMGYYALPMGAETGFTNCVDELEALNARLARMATVIDGVYYAAAADAIDPADPANYDPDRIHPSPKGSRSIGALLARAILEAEREQPE